MLCLQLFLGIAPDAPRGRCLVAPRLPRWLPRLEVRGLSVGDGSLSVSLRQHGEETVIEELVGKDLEVVQAQAEAPLWGLPPTGRRPD
jgi:hypothetical protein